MEESNHCIPQPTVSQALLVSDARALERGELLRACPRRGFDSGLCEKTALSKLMYFLVQYFPKILSILPNYRIVYWGGEWGFHSPLIIF